MSRSIRRIHKGVFFAATAVALGFGAQMALATPASAAPKAPPRCDNATCNAECQATTGGIGFCSLGHCYCPPRVPVY